MVSNHLLSVGVSFANRVAGFIGNSTDIIKALG